MEINIEARKEKAVAYFNEGYNCAQSVFLAYSDLYDLNEEFAKKISAPFGAGMGRLREVCGAVTASFMIMGLQYPAIDPTNQDEKTTNYAAVQRCGLAFKEKYGTYICADLLNLEHNPESPSPSERTAEYYSTRPCVCFVAEAAEIVGKELQ